MTEEIPVPDFWDAVAQDGSPPTDQEPLVVIWTVAEPVPTIREELAEMELPELREKLWDEYRRYKASLGGSSKDGK